MIGCIKIKTTGPRPKLEPAAYQLGQEGSVSEGIKESVNRVKLYFGKI